MTPKQKKKSHKSRRDKSSDNVKSGSLSERDSVKKSDGKQKKRDRSRSPSSKTSAKHAHSSPPSVLTSSGPESAKTPANVKGDAVDRPSSVADKGVPPSSQTMSSDKSQPVQEQTFAGTGACAYWSHEESGLYEQFSEFEEGKDDDRDRSGELSWSEDGHLSDITDPPGQTEDMSY